MLPIGVIGTGAAGFFRRVGAPDCLADLINMWRGHDDPIAGRAEFKPAHLLTQVGHLTFRFNSLALSAGLMAWEKSIGVNLRGPVFLVERALPHLTESPHGVILNVISAGAFLFSARTSMYSAAKAGLMAMTRAQAADLADRGIRSNALAPGTVDTDMVRNNTPEQVASMAAASFMKRAADPDEMVGPAIFLVSDASSFMTGQVVIVDGGLTPH